MRYDVVVVGGGLAGACAALSAKGLMTAPLLASDLSSFLADPEKLPVEVRPPG